MTWGRVRSWPTQNEKINGRPPRRRFMRPTQRPLAGLNWIGEKIAFHADFKGIGNSAEKDILKDCVSC